jgi:hypothetical protein
VTSPRPAHSACPPRVSPRATAPRPALACFQRSESKLLGISSVPVEVATVNDDGGRYAVWAWILIIVLLVLLLSGGVYLRR